MMRMFASILNRIADESIILNNFLTSNSSPYSVNQFPPLTFSDNLSSEECYFLSILKQESHKPTVKKCFGISVLQSSLTYGRTILIFHGMIIAPVGEVLRGERVHNPSDFL